MSCLIADNAGSLDEQWIYNQYVTGNVDTLRSIVESISEQSAAGQFLRGIFERNGETAKFYFDRSIVLYSGSLFEASALERLWQHHWTVGDTANARKYINFLKQRHPESSNSEYVPEFVNIGDLKELSANKSTTINWRKFKQEYWTIQLGAFRNRNGALWVANKARAWGQINLRDKNIRGKVLTVVQLGKFSRRKDASDLESRIRTETDLKGRVVLVKP